MVADIGTKALPKQRLFELMERMKLTKFEECEKKEVREEEKTLQKEEEIRGEVLLEELQRLSEDLPEELCEKVKKVRFEDETKTSSPKEILQMLMVFSMLRGVHAQRDGDEVPYGFYMFVLGYTVMIIAVTILCQMWWNREINSPAVQQSSESSTRKKPMSPEELLALAEEVKCQAREVLKSKDSESQKKCVLAAKAKERSKEDAASGSSSMSFTACAGAVSPEVELTEAFLEAEIANLDVTGHCGGSSSVEGGPRQSVFITAFGEKYHMQKDCKFLANARRVAKSDPCSACVPAHWTPGGKIVNVGIDRAFHTSRHGSLASSEVRILLPCAGCAKGLSQESEPGTGG